MISEFCVRFFSLVSSIIGAVSTLTLTWTSHPDSNFPYFSFLSLTLFQLAVGIYNAGLFSTDDCAGIDITGPKKLNLAMATTQNSLIPHQHRTAVESWFRIPLKLIACANLVSLHSDDNQHGNRKLFICCSVLMMLAIFSSILLRQSKKKNSGSDQLETTKILENTQI